VAVWAFTSAAQWQERGMTHGYPMAAVGALMCCWNLVWGYALYQKLKERQGEEPNPPAPRPYLYCIRRLSIVKHFIEKAFVVQTQGRPRGLKDDFSNR
jgi:hypothetical protein